jgi:hypothetical protein
VQRDRLLIHWLDREMGHYSGVAARVRPDVLEQMLRDAMVVSLLVARESVLVPASSLFENPRVSPLLEALAPFREAGLLRFVGGDRSAEEFLEAKRESYAVEPTRYPLTNGRPGCGWYG